MYDPNEPDKPFNGLTPAQVERLAILAEEAGEVIQIVGKILRHGYESYNPLKPDCPNNRRLLENELGDFHYAVNALIRDKELNPLRIGSAALWKGKRVKQYLHHNKD